MLENKNNVKTINVGFFLAPLRDNNLSNTWLTYIKAKLVKFIKHYFLSVVKLNKTEIDSK